MRVIPPVRVKVSCLGTPEEARSVVSLGAVAIGVASEVPASDDELTDEQIAAIAGAVAPDVGTFLLTALEDPADIVAKAKRCAVNTVQLWETLPVEAYADIRRAAPSLSIAQTIHVVDESALDRALDLAERVDALVLASTNPEPPFRWSDPHGRTHDWALSRRIAEAVRAPVILSGGLTHRNVADAVRQVRPYGVEVCTGVRRDGRLHTPLLVEFLEALGRLRPD